MVAKGDQHIAQFAPEVFAERQKVLRVRDRQLRHHENSDLVGHFEELGWRDKRVESDCIESKILRQLEAIDDDASFPTREPGENLDVVIAIPAQIIRFAIQQERVTAGGNLTETEGLLVPVDFATSLKHLNGSPGQSGIFGRPERRTGQGQDQRDFFAVNVGLDGFTRWDADAHRQSARILRCDGNAENGLTPLHVGHHQHGLNARPGKGLKGDIPRETAPVAEVVQHAGRLHRLLRDGPFADLHGRILDPENDHVARPRADCAGDIEGEWSADAVVPTHLSPIHVRGSDSMRAPDSQQHGLVSPGGGNFDGPAIPGDSLIIVAQPVRRLSETLRLPCSGHLDAIRKAGAGVREPPPGNTGILAIEAELPGPIEVQTEARCAVREHAQYGKTERSQSISQSHQHECAS
jgi:hypothetical protein